MNRFVRSIALGLVVLAMQGNKISANQSEWCHPATLVLNFDVSGNNLQLTFRDDGKPHCTLYGSEFSQKKLFVAPEIEVNFNGRKNFVAPKCVDDFQTDASAVRVSQGKAGTAVMIFGRHAKPSKGDRLQFYLIDGEVICAGMAQE